MSSHSKASHNKRTLDTSTIAALASYTFSSKLKRGQSGPIKNYLGDPLHWHISDDGTGGVKVLIDQIGPNECTNKTFGPISEIKVKYATPETPTPPTQTIVWATPGLQYIGRGLTLYLTEDPNSPADILLVVDDGSLQAHRDGDPNDRTPYFVRLELAASVTTDKDRAYFVNVPVPRRDLATSATPSWSPDSGSIAGPIGGIDVP